MNTAPSAAAMRRRDFLATVATGLTGALLLSSAPPLAANPVSPAAAPTTREGRLIQGICPGVFKGANLSDDEMCRVAAEAGMVGIDLWGPEKFATLKKYGLIPTMVPGGSGLNAGINDPRLHPEIAGKMRAALKVAADAGAPNVIVLAGVRGSLSDEQSLENAVTFLNQLKGDAEHAGVTLCVETLNSKVDHPGYVGDRTAWCVELCKRVNSPRVKVLYDIYHMQIMEGDVIRTIRANIDYIAHIHTAGNPGRHEFDETQELNYRPICRAIADLNFKGIVSHEYTPTKDPIGTLHRMIKICEV